MGIVSSLCSRIEIKFQLSIFLTGLCCLLLSVTFGSHARANSCLEALHPDRKSRDLQVEIKASDLVPTAFPESNPLNPIKNPVEMWMRLYERVKHKKRVNSAASREEYLNISVPERLPVVRQMLADVQILNSKVGQNQTLSALETRLTHLINEGVPYLDLIKTLTPYAEAMDMNGYPVRDLMEEPSFFLAVEKAMAHPENTKLFNLALNLPAGFLIPTFAEISIDSMIRSRAAPIYYLQLKSSVQYELKGHYKIGKSWFPHTILGHDENHAKLMAEVDAGVGRPFTPKEVLESAKFIDQFLQARDQVLAKDRKDGDAITIVLFIFAHEWGRSRLNPTDIRAALKRLDEAREHNAPTIVQNILRGANEGQFGPRYMNGYFKLDNFERAISWLYQMTEFKK